jgi:hypothetical protein
MRSKLTQRWEQCLTGSNPQTPSTRIPVLVKHKPFECFLKAASHDGAASGQDQFDPNHDGCPTIFDNDGTPLTMAPSELVIDH